MEPATLARSIESLTRLTASGEPLHRPPEIEAEIATALELSRYQVLASAAAEPDTENAMSEECIVHLIRHSLRLGLGQADPGGLADDLLPILLRRSEANLRGAIRGFSRGEAQEIREDVLGRLAVSLVEPGDAADFFEVRFALALKRWRIDACRRQRRRARGRVVFDETSRTADSGAEGSASGAQSDREFDRQLDRHRPEPARQEDRLLIQQALKRLDDSERKVLVLHKLAGLPLRSQAPQEADLVGLLGLSERTLRNRLRSAESKLRIYGGGEP